MTTNHPAHGPVSLDRLHQISEILSKAAAQSDGGNVGYAMADAVKVIDSAIASFGAEPVAWFSDNYAQNKGLMFGEKEKGAGPTFIAKYWDLEMFDGNQDWLSDAIENTKAKPLYTAPPAPVVPDEYRHLSELYHAQEKRLFKLAQRIKGPSFDKYSHSPSQAIDVLEAVIFGEGDDSCLAVMQSFGNSEQLDEVGSWNNHMNTPTAQAGNSPVIGVDLASGPDRTVEVRYVAPPGYVMVPKKLTAENGAKGVLSGEFSETKFINCPECFGDDDCETCDGSGRIEITVPVTWTTIKAIWAKGVEHFAAAPQQEVKS